MSSNFFNVGNTLEALNNAKNAVAEQNFQNALEDIQDTANEKLTLYGDIEKGSGTLLGGIAGAKAVVGGFKKFKQKLSDFKNKGKSLEEKNSEGGADNDAGDAEEGLDGLTDNLTETAENLTSNLTDNLSSITDNVSNVVNNAVSQVGNTAENLVSNATNTIQDGLSSATETLQNGMDGIVNSGRDMLNNLVRNGTMETQPQELEMSNMAGRTEALPSEDANVSSNATQVVDDGSITRGGGFEGLEAEEETETLGRNLFSRGLGRPTGAGSGNIGERPTQVGGEDFPEPPTDQEFFADRVGTEDFPDLPDADESGEAGIPADDPASEFGGTQAEGIEGITTDTDFGVPAIDTAGEVAGEAVAEGTAEAVGAGLDATGIGAIIGIPLQILGLVGAGAGVLTGIFGSDSASNTETQATQKAQKAEAQAKALPANVAGKFAPAVQSQAQRLVGGY